MQNIPKIGFEPANKGIQGFEMISLSSLFARKEELIRANHDPFRPHRLNFFVIIILTDGSVKHTVDFENCKLTKGDCLIISKGQVHAFDEQSSYQGFMVLFTEEFLQKYVALSSLKKIEQLYNYFLGQNVFHSPQYANLLVKNLQEELALANLIVQPNIVGALLTIFLLKLIDQKERIEPSTTINLHNQYFNQFRQLLEQNYAQTRDAKDYAAEMLISYKHLNTICKRIINQTAKAFIDSFVILEAKRQLVSTSLTIKEISYQLGFDEPTNFLKYFKKHTSLTPSTFRKRLA